MLKLRTVKRDGSIHEPEFVEGKPTVTMPHLEVGDYIEMENLFVLRGDGQGGLTFQGPRWFFREEKVPYWRSEFIVVSPKSRPLDVEACGSVPGAGDRRVRRARHPPLAGRQEPRAPRGAGQRADLRSSCRTCASAGASAWTARSRAWSTRPPTRRRAIRGSCASRGRSRVAYAARAARRRTRRGGEHGRPPAPRRMRAARATGAAPSKDEQARRIYRWVLANVEAGREDDGRRVVIGKSGNRTEAFLYLCRLVGIDAGYGVVSDRLTAPPRAAHERGRDVQRARRPPRHRGEARRGRGPLDVRARQVRAVRLPAELPPRAAGDRAEARDAARGDALVRRARRRGHGGRRRGGEDGSASLAIEQRYEGKLAIALRSALESLPDAQLRDAVESRLLPQMVPGARLQEIEIKELSEIDRPLTLKMKIAAASFARAQGGELVITPPFGVRVASLASLPVRETPLYLSEQIATRSEVRLRVKLPAGARVVTQLAPSTADDEGRAVRVNDRVDGARWSSIASSICPRAACSPMRIRSSSSSPARRTARSTGTSSCSSTATDAERGAPLAARRASIAGIPVCQRTQDGLLFCSLP